jgi:peroxiredoxin
MEQKIFRIMRGSIILFGILTLAACNKEEQRTVISGRISNAAKAKLMLEEVGVYESIPVDSVVLQKNGKFRFTIKSKEPGFYQLKLPNNRIIVLFPRPGQHITLNADANNIVTSLQAEGSNDTEQASKLIKYCYETKLKLDTLDSIFARATSDSIRSRLDKEYQKIVDDQRKVSITFILTHYNSLASIYALYQQYQPGSYVFYKPTDMQFFRIISDSLAKYIPGSKHVIALKAYTNRMIGDYETQKLLQNSDKVSVGLPDISLPDFAGDTTSMQSLKSRYIFLTFWATTSTTSVNQNLELKKVYSKFRNNSFEIYQVSFDKSVDTWREAVRYDELPWISVIDTRYPNSPVVGNYNVVAIPMNYLIDNNTANILARNLTPAQLQQKLEELF